MTTTVIITYAIDRSILLGDTAVGIHGMTSGDSTDIALSFLAGGTCTGLSVGFHASTEEIRAFAAEMVRHADITDAARLKGDAGQAIEAGEA